MADVGSDEFSMRRIIALMLYLTLVASNDAIASGIEKAVHYSPPPHFEAFQLNSDPGDSPFSGDGPGFQFLCGRDDLIFQVGVIRFSIGKGKVVTYFPVGPAELRESLSQTFGGRLEILAPCVLTNVSGLVAATISGKSKNLNGGRVPQQFLTVYWVQIQTNIVLKISAVSQTAAGLENMTSSLTSLRIDRDALLKALRPKPQIPPKITEDTVNELEVGYIIRDRPYAGFVYRTKAKTYFFTINDGRHPLKTADTEEMLMGKIIKYAHDPKIHCSLILEIQPHSGAAKASGSTRFNFEDGVHNGGDLGDIEIRDAQFFGAWDIVDTGPPPDFHRIFDHRINLELVIQEVQPQDPD